MKNYPWDVYFMVLLAFAALSGFTLLLNFIFGSRKRDKHRFEMPTFRDIAEISVQIVLPILFGVFVLVFFEYSHEIVPSSRQGSPAYSYVASINSDKVHVLDCRSAANISSSNKIYFISLDEAEDEGYYPCKICLSD